MTNEDRLRSRLRALDHIEPSPGLLERARQSGPRQPTAGPSASRRLIMVVTAFAVFGASAILVWRAFDPTGTHGTPRSTPGQRHQPPDWVVRAAIQTATNNQDPTPASAYWILADSNIVGPVVDPSAGTGASRGQEYLVVLYGSFTDGNARGLGAPPTGSVITFTLDPQSHAVNDFGLTSQPVHLAGLQAFSLQLSGSRSYTNPMGIPITLEYPSAWSAQSVNHPKDVTGPRQVGVVISNTPSAMPSPGAATPSPGPLPENPGLPSDFVTVTVLANGSGQPKLGMTDSLLPLSMDHAKVVPGSGNDRILTAWVAGVRLLISVHAGPRASAANLAIASQVVGSIRPTDAGPSLAPASPPPAGLTGSLVFATGREGASELFRYDLATGDTTDLGPGRDPSVSPDGTQIAFRLGNADRPGGMATRIGIMQIDGSHAQIINVPGSIENEPLGAGAPTWSPDGSRLAFSAGIGVYIYDGQGVTPVTQYPGSTLSCYDLEPAWSPDGASIVFAVRCDGGNLGIWSVDTNGANRHQITVPTPGGVIDYRYPSWSPDGASLLFEGVARHQGYSYDSYVMDRSGAVTKVTRSACERPVWSSDGRWIACTWAQIGLVRPTGSGLIRLTPFPGQTVTSVAWIPSS